MKTRVRRHPVSLLAALLLPLALLVGCGGDDSGGSATDPAPAPTSASATPTESPSETASETATSSAPPKGPACDEVWVDGGKLPGGYQDCYADDKRVKANGRYCEFGKTLITHQDQFWAVPGGRISEVGGKLLDDAGYRSALAMCSG